MSKLGEPPSPDDKGKDEYYVGGPSKVKVKVKKGDKLMQIDADSDVYVIRASKKSKKSKSKSKTKTKTKKKGKTRPNIVPMPPPALVMTSVPAPIRTKTGHPKPRSCPCSCYCPISSSSSTSKISTPSDDTANICVKLAKKSPENLWSHVVSRDDPVNHAVQFMFYRPSMMNSATVYVYAINWLVAWCTSNGDETMDFCHVEICFPNGMCTSVCGGMTVHFGYKSWAKENDQSMCGLTVQLPGPEQVERMYTWCRNQALSAVPFNKFGTWWNFVVPCSGHVCPYRAKGRAFFCSEYSLTALQEVGISLTDGISEDLDPATVSPTDLYLILEKQGLISGGTVTVFHDRNVSFVCKLLDATVTIPP